MPSCETFIICVEGVSGETLVLQSLRGVSSAPPPIGATTQSRTVAALQCIAYALQGSAMHLPDTAKSML
eukprot:6939741-Pyramimonas_sp.AAC.2